LFRGALQVSGFILNLKLLSESRKGEESLIDILKKIKNRKIRRPISSDREVAIRTAFTTKVGKNEVLYGKFVSAIDLSDTDWLNLSNMEKEHYPVPKNLRAKIRENEFILIEKAHRLFLFNSSNDNLTHKQIQTFLLSAIKDVIKEDEDIEVITEKDSEGVKQIMDASYVEWIDIQISRSNNDNNEDAAEWLEAELDEMNVTKFNGKFITKDSDGINLSSKILKGALELSNSNGEIKARISDENGKSKVIKTAEYEKKFQLPITGEETKIFDVVTYVMDLFRN